MPFGALLPASTFSRAASHVRLPETRDTVGALEVVMVLIKIRSEWSRIVFNRVWRREAVPRLSSSMTMHRSRGVLLPCVLRPLTSGLSNCREKWEMQCTIDFGTE